MWQRTNQGSVLSQRTNQRSVLTVYLVHLSVDVGQDGAHDGAEVDGGDEQHQQQLPRALLVLHLQRKSIKCAELLVFDNLMPRIFLNIFRCDNNFDYKLKNIYNTIHQQIIF